MPQAPGAPQPASQTPYPRSPLVRGLRLLLRVLWILILLGGLAVIAPNVWAQYQKSQGLSGLLDPNNLTSIFYIPQLTQLLSGNTTLLLGGAISAGILFLILFLLGLWAGRDARRERRALRQPGAPPLASAMASPMTATAAVPAPATVVRLAPGSRPLMAEPLMATSALSDPAPAAESAVAPPAEPVPPPATTPPLAPSFDPVSVAVVAPSFEPAGEVVSRPFDQPVFGPSFQPPIEPPAETLPAPEPAPEPLAASLAEPAFESTPEPVDAPASEPVAESVATLAELSAEPIATPDPAVESAPEPLTPLIPLAADPIAGGMPESIPDQASIPADEPLAESLAEQRFPSAATAYSTVISTPAVPTAPQEAPTMSSLPPQVPPDGSDDTPPAQPNWWTAAPVVPIAPTAPQPPAAAPYAQPYAPPYTSPPSQPYVTPLSQPYVTPPSQPYPPQVPAGQPYQPYAPPQMPGGQQYYPSQPPTPAGAPGAPGSSQGFGQKAMASVPLLASAAQLVGQITAPVQDETGISPAPFAAQAPGWAHTRPLTDAQLGDRIDGWADTVVGMADKAPLMIQALVQDLPTHFRPATQSVSTRLGMTGMSTLARGIDMPLSPVAVARVAQSIMPTITVLPRLILRLFGVTIVGKQRDYLFAVTTPGAIVGIMITGAGQDLYMAWDLFLRRVWNEIAIGLLTLIAMAVGVIAGIGAVRAATSFSYFYTPSPLQLAIAFVLAFLTAGLTALVVVFGALAILGLIFRRDPLAFFRKSIDLFEAHDIASMELSVDKALRRAADKAGIDSKLLRAKEDYTSGRDRRVI